MHPDHRAQSQSVLFVSIFRSSIAQLGRCPPVRTEGGQRWETVMLDGMRNFRAISVVFLM